MKPVTRLCWPRSAAAFVAIALLLGACETAGPRHPDSGAAEKADRQPSTAEPRGSKRANYGGPEVALEDLELAQDSGLNEIEMYRGSGVLARPPKASKIEVDEVADGRVTLNFAGAQIGEVVDAVIGETLGANYAIDPNVSGTVTARTSAPIPRKDVVPALENILALHDLALTYADGIYKIQPIEKAAQDLTTPVVGAGAKNLGRGFGIHVIPLAYVSARTLKPTLQEFVAPGRILRADPERNLLIFAGPGPEARDLVAMVDVFDVDWLAGMSFALYPLDIAEAEKVVAELQTVFGQDAEGPLAGMIRFMPIERLNAILAITSQPSYLDKARAWVRRFDRGAGGTERRIFVYFVQNVQAEELAQVMNEIFAARTGGESERQRGEVAPGLRPVTIEPRQPGAGTTGTQPRARGEGAEPDAGTRAESQQTAQSAEGEASAQPPSRGARTAGRVRQARAPGQTISQSVPEISEAGDIRIIADDKRNALVILATADQYRMIESTLKRLDIVPLQVLIEATILEVSLQDELRYGLNWFFSAGDSEVTFSTLQTGAVAAQFPGFSYFFDSSDVKVVLNALKDITDVNVVSSPQLMVLDNQSARLQVGDQVPIATQEQQGITDDARIVNAIQFRDTGVILEVTPRVNASGLVVLEILQEVSDVVPTTTSGLNSPTIQQRSIESTVAVNSGDTVALGGLIRDNQSDGERGVPVLADIPILGNLFKVTTRTVDRTELLVLLTPRVVRDRGEAQEVTQELRERLSTVAPLERRVQEPRREAN